ncbi:MAG: SBBP repeat-containing protein [Deltaproteobacteria bacterium]|nr:SBBP repeat-containing protein [Deltaproteobacteria bacterium]
MALALAAAGVFTSTACGTKKEAGKEAAPVAQPAAPQVKKPLDSKPLPALAADPGGATGKPVWAIGFGGLGSESVRDVAVTATGDIYVAGYFDGETELGAGGTYASVGDKTSDAYLVKLAGDGKVAWGRTFGNQRDDTANAVAVKGDGVAVAGNFLDELALGELKHKSSGSDDLYVAAFDAAGEPKWLYTAGGIDSDGANTIAATPDGGWIVGGSFMDVGTFDPTRTLKSKGGTDAVLIKLAASGDLEWIKQFGGKHNDSVRHLAVDAQGNIYVQGTFRDTAEWGGAPMTAGGASSDIVLAKYDLNGDHVWSVRHGNAFEEGASGVVVDPAGNITMVGSFDRGISFGAGDDHTSLGESDVFVASFTNDGKLAWARTWGADRNDAAAAVAADTAGNVIVTGWFEGTVDFGKGAVASKGNKEVFAAKLDPKGALVWAQSWGDKDHDQGRALAVDSAGAIYVAGLYRFKLDLTAAPALESKRADGDRIPKADTFVVKLER